MASDTNPPSYDFEPVLDLIPTGAERLTQDLSEKPEFCFSDLQSLSQKIASAPVVVRARIWPSDDQKKGWTIECMNFNEFTRLCTDLKSNIDILGYDEIFLDDELISEIEVEMLELAELQNQPLDFVPKIISALRSHENKLVSIMAYAFINSGHVVYVKSQTRLSRLIRNPSKLFSQDSINLIRKLKPLPMPS